MYTLELTDEGNEQVRQEILAPLIEFNISRAGPYLGGPLAIVVRDDAGKTIGGLWGHTGYQWLFTELLVVPESLRGQGLGTRLLKMAEAEAVRRGCLGSWLDTYEFQARGFYERLGYECFAELPHYPTGHSRFFMKRILGEAAP